MPCFVHFGTGCGAHSKHSSTPCPKLSTEPPGARSLETSLYCVITYMCLEPICHLCNHIDLSNRLSTDLSIHTCVFALSRMCCAFLLSNRFFCRLELFERYLQKMLSRVITPLDTFTKPPEAFGCSWARQLVSHRAATWKHGH